MKRSKSSYWIMAVIVGLVGIMLASLSACSYPVRNIELESIGDGYQWTQPADEALADTLIIVTASGGGTRAAALALGTLHGLDAVDVPRDGETVRLLDEVDIVSSVSGGSVTAAYYALHGRRGFATLEEDFIRQDAMGALMWRGLNPVGLARLATPAYARVDVLADYFDDQLFKGATYQDLQGDRRRPYLVLNAADMTRLSVFPFTQPTFDLLCSDLAQFRLADAVAASAAFPTVFVTTLVNYSPCPAQGDAWGTDRPPIWVENATGTPWYDNATRVRRGRNAEAYVNLEHDAEVPRTDYVHLLDGGIADNLGVAEPLRLLTTVDVSPQYFTDITQGRIDKVVFVMINARSDPVSELTASPAPPGILSRGMASVGAAIDNASFRSTSMIETLLGQALPRQPETYLIRVDFDAINDRDCRIGFQNIDTSWTLPDQEIDAVIEVAGSLLQQDPDFQRLVADLGARMPQLPDVDSACRTLAN